HVTDAVLPPGRHSWSLVRAVLLLAAAGFRLGQAHGVSLGGYSSTYPQCARARCIQHLAFRPRPLGPNDGRAWRLRGLAQSHVDGSARRYAAGPTAQRARSVDWADRFR